MRTTRSGESVLLLLDVVEVLSAQQIDYAVVGALAAAIHGAVRASMDPDVVLSVSVARADSIGQTLRAAGLRTELTRGDLDDPVRRDLTRSQAGQTARKAFRQRRVGILGTASEYLNVC